MAETDSELDVDLGRNFVGRSLSLADCPEEILSVEFDHFVTTAADQLVVRLKPTDAFRMFVAALRARNSNRV